MPEDDKLNERLGRIEQALDVLAGRLAALERVLGTAGDPRSAPDLRGSGEEPIERALKKRVADLEADKATLTQRVASLAEGRVHASPEQVTEGFRKAIVALQSGLAPRPGDGTAYAVSEMQVGLKSLVALDQTGALRFVLPAPEERFDAAQLTEVRFTLRAVAGEPAGVDALLPVPSLLGLPLPAALAALDRAGLKPGRRAEQESRYAPGTVIGQSPDPNDEVAADLPIDLVLAVPVRPTVPELRGLPLDEANARIEASGLAPGRVTPRETREVEAGRVLTQEPLAGIRVALGAAVALTVSVAPPPTVTVPDVTRRARAQAEAALKAAGLPLGAVSEKPAGKPGLVLDQAPPAGTEVAPGSPVSLIISASVEVSVLIDRAVREAAGTRSGISGKLLGERLRALDLKDYAAFEALAAAPLDELQTAIGAPTPRGLQDAQGALRKALDSTE
jgi:hypothetical protein